MLWVGLDGKSALQRAGVKRLSIYTNVTVKD